MKDETTSEETKQSDIYKLRTGALDKMLFQEVNIQTHVIKMHYSLEIKYFPYRAYRENKK